MRSIYQEEQIVSECNRCVGCLLGRPCKFAFKVCQLKIPGEYKKIDVGNRELEKIMGISQ